MAEAEETIISPSAQIRAQRASSGMTEAATECFDTPEPARLAPATPQNAPTKPLPSVNQPGPLPASYKTSVMDSHPNIFGDPRALTPVDDFPPAPPGYVFLQAVGRGAMGAVYKAQQVGLDRLVAVKVSSTADSTAAHESTLDAQVMERLRREGRALAGLNHQNIVQVFDWIGTERRIYLIMEYLEGLTLDRLMRSPVHSLREPFRSMRREGGRITFETILFIGTSVCRALQAAHDKGVVHRDVKPSNIFLTGDTGVKLIDFGIARAEEMGGLTATGLVVGTPAYMSPEQVQERKPDGRSDVYSLGCVLFHAATGRVPYSDTSQVLLASKHVMAPVPDIPDFGGQVPDPLAQVIIRCLQKHPEDRYQSAAELDLALQEIYHEISAENEQSTAEGQYAQTKPRKAVTRNETAIVTEPMSPAWVAAQQPVDASHIAPTVLRPYTQGQQAKAGSGRGWLVLVLLLTLAGGAAGYLKRGELRAAWTRLMAQPQVGETPSASGEVGAEPDPVSISTPASQPDAGTEATVGPQWPASIQPLTPDAEARARANWETLVAWTTRELSAGAPLLGQDILLLPTAMPVPGKLPLQVAHDSPERLHYATYVASGQLDVLEIDFANGWQVRRRTMPLAGSLAGHASGGNVQALSTQGSAIDLLASAPVSPPHTAPLSFSLAVEDLRLVIVDPGRMPLIPNLPAVRAFAEAGLSRNALAGPVSVEYRWGDPTRAASVPGLPDPAAEARRLMTLSEADGNRVSPLLSSLGDDDAGTAAVAFLREATLAAADGRLLNRIDIGDPVVGIEPRGGSITLRVALPPHPGLKVSCLVVDGEQSVLLYRGLDEDPEPHWRPLRGLAVTAQEGQSFVLATPLSDAGRQATYRYRANQRLEVRTIVVFATRPSPSTGAGRPAVDLASALKVMRNIKITGN